MLMPVKKARGLLIVFSGPSGVGKDAVLAEFRKICPEVRKCVSVTTRHDNRPDEAEGVDYSFVTTDEFHRLIEQGHFLEHANVYDDLYGTPRKWVEETLAAGHDALLKIDVQGGIAVKREMPESVMVFLGPPSLEELERRLRTRATEGEPALQRRLQNAAKELEEIPNYDYFIENDSLPRAAEELKAVIIAEHCRIK